MHDIVKAQLRVEQHDGGVVDDLDDLDGDDGLFQDVDVDRGFGMGIYVFDEAEARSRRLDMGDCADPDRGPIALGPADDEVQATVLWFDQG